MRTRSNGTFGLLEYQPIAQAPKEQDIYNVSDAGHYIAARANSPGLPLSRLIENTT